MNSTPRVDSTTTDPRDQKAAALLAEGKVTLHFDGSASVRGSGKAVYTIRRDADGVTHCTCPDNYRRGARCKHLRATAALCKLARACRQQAQETGRTRLPYLLGLALRGQAIPTPAAKTVPCHKCGQPAPAKLGECADCWLGYSVAA